MVGGPNLARFILGQHSMDLEEMYVSMVYVALEHAGENRQEKYPWEGIFSNKIFSW